MACMQRKQAAMCPPWRIGPPNMKTNYPKTSLTHKLTSPPIHAKPVHDNKLRMGAVNVMKTVRFFRLLTITISISILAVGWIASTHAAEVVVDGLTCEYLHDPLGIDVQKPRLSWKLQPVEDGARDIEQIAFQILVASDVKTLSKNEGDLWDSDFIKSNQSALIEYAGNPLKSRMECYWKVRVVTGDKHISKWSKPAYWSMGLLDKKDWQAEWIGAKRAFERKPGWPPPDNDMPDPWFRKQFTLDAIPKRATVYAASIGYQELYVNGHKITDAVLMPSVSNLRERARYVTYDITKYLKEGNNVIGFWLGVSWSIFPLYQTEFRPATPMVMAQAELDFQNAPTQRITTDAGWITHPSPNTTIGVWDFMHFGGELYDARKEMPLWCSHRIDTSNWEPVTVYYPKVKVSAEMLEPNRVLDQVDPIHIAKVGEKEYRIDLGVVMNGWFVMDLRGEPGQRIDFQFSEQEDKAMTHRHRSAYILGGTGRGTFKNHFNYFSGRWVQVKGLNYKPKKEDIRAYLVRTDYARAAHFRCNNGLLNDIYETTLWTFECLSLGGYVVDCPQRERMGYGGDGHATIDCGLANYNTGAFYTKWCQDWRDVQDGNGNLPYTSPTFWGGGGPAWSGYCITMPWEIYKQYGDTRVLRDNFDTMQRWLAFLDTKNIDDLLVRWGGNWDFLGDWLWPKAQGTNGDTRETLFFNNCFWVFNLQTMAEICRVLDKRDLAQAYHDRADEVREAIHDDFYNEDDGSYVNGFQAYLAIALLTDIPPQQEREKVWDRLEKEIRVVRDGHIHAGITGGAFLLKTLMQYDRDDLIHAMAAKETYPSWGDMLKQGATTIWEDWEGRENHSFLHSSYLYIGPWFVEGLAGIQPGRAQEFIIDPPMLQGNPIDNCRGSYESLYGNVESQWQIREGEMRLTVTIPANTRAIVKLPCKSPTQVKENNKPLSDGKGIKYIADTPEGINI
ncbi:Bacterial alpha-L-rhamnosidase, partial [bacterium]|nr:Bacterial alpha-L-rhamnosidase [bacterium]